MWAPGPAELIIIVLVVMLLFGAKRLPELARGSGRALRIFKSETRGLMEDDDKQDEPPRPLTSGENGTAAPRAATPVDDPAPRRPEGSAPYSSERPAPASSERSTPRHPEH
ncbi:MAG: Sec-independent protein translocase subunit TatA [Actinomycetota bacterium]|nr:Sec-independent protein translocase subunit TatA [Actinomycetota bacterium]